MLVPRVPQCHIYVIRLSAVVTKKNKENDEVLLQRQQTYPNGHLVTYFIKSLYDLLLVQWKSGNFLHIVNNNDSFTET